MVRKISAREAGRVAARGMKAIKKAAGEAQKAAKHAIKASKEFKAGYEQEMKRK